jgi:hypothetical protein
MDSGDFALQFHSHFLTHRISKGHLRDQGGDGEVLGVFNLHISRGVLEMLNVVKSSIFPSHHRKSRDK